ncbi:hypothetical protein SARC_09905 [Sphaeroforma arctica JP610]|uniref:Uncharacterized protein n=1 Tax=Sphaeroforma arctica JP610 TaxID=667725 RepID=A0A0L0FNS8_9EUKA|nr:hypothetical protein SARC_09905 [Sphaeroforma arctica JP610]KNC77633.1 hypothetical protein SARC_09905 [Sphaeroforma arctica JP610]|eukprot:XP_014151535.1 hypothetical protein SARC_09905 [Sphaeroforma arctica JP610]
MSVGTVVAGIALDMVVGTMLLRQGSDSLFMFWIVAEALVPVFLSIAIYASSTVGLPFLLLGLFKLVFPETIEGVANSKLLSSESPTESSMRTWCRLGGQGFVSAVATLLHHGLTAYVVAALYTGAVVMSRPLVLCMLPLVLQHLLVPLKYTHQFSFIVEVIVVEIFF